MQQTSSAGRATLVLTNRSSTARLVTLRSRESDSFRVVTDPGTPLRLAPGGSASLLLRVEVVHWAGAGRLSNWADGMTLVVQSSRAADPATLGLRDVLLAPAGGSVAATCR